MKIIVDSREQNALSFEHKYITEVKVAKLDYADYIVEFEDGYRPPFCFERKTLGDLFGTLGKGYPRFKRELIRAQEAGVKVFIVIEGSLSKIIGGYKYSTLEGISILRKLLTLWIRHGIGFHCFKDRGEISTFMVETFATLGKEYLRVGKTNHNAP